MNILLTVCPKRIRCSFTLPEHFLNKTKYARYKALLRRKAHKFLQYRFPSQSRCTSGNFIFPFPLLLGSGARRRSRYTRTRTIIAMKIVALGQMSHGDKGLTAGWREMHRTCAPVRCVNPKIHYCSLSRASERAKRADCSRAGRSGERDAWQ